MLGCGRHSRDRFVLRVRRRLEHHVDLADRKAAQRQIERHVELGDLAELELEEIDIPAGIERNLVVGDPQGPLLRFAEMLQRDGRSLSQADCLGGQEPAVPGDDRGVAIDQDRVAKAKGAD